MPKNFFMPKTFFTPKNFFNAKMFLERNFSWKEIGGQTFFGVRNFGVKNLRPNI